MKVANDERQQSSQESRFSISNSRIRSVFVPWSESVNAPYFVHPHIFYAIADHFAASETIISVRNVNGIVKMAQIFDIRASSLLHLGSANIGCVWVERQVEQQIIVKRKVFLLSNRT